jgi:hypothetical protein
MSHEGEHGGGGGGEAAKSGFEKGLGRLFAFLMMIPHAIWGYTSSVEIQSTWTKMNEAV